MTCREYFENAPFFDSPELATLYGDEKLTSAIKSL